MVEYGSSGTKYVSYSYDAWGNATVTYHNGGESTIAAKNPFRYRGYYYDSDLGLYYNNTRYYDSKTCRWINADKYASTGMDLLGYNMFAYCYNNPVVYEDNSGEFPLLIVGILALGAIGGGILGYVSNVPLTGTAPKQQTAVESEKSITETSSEDKEELSTGAKIANIAIGAGLGIAAAGLTTIAIGAGASLGAASAVKTIGFLNMTGAQAVAIGALEYNILPFLIAPFLGIEAEVLEL